MQHALCSGLPIEPERKKNKAGERAGLHWPYQEAKTFYVSAAGSWLNIQGDCCAPKITTSRRLNNTREGLLRDTLTSTSARKSFTARA